MTSPRAARKLKPGLSVAYCRPTSSLFKCIGARRQSAPTPWMMWSGSGRAANAAPRASMGVALSSCEIPVPAGPRFELPDGAMEIGMESMVSRGIRRGPPGNRQTRWPRPSRAPSLSDFGVVEPASELPHGQPLGATSTNRADASSLWRSARDWKRRCGGLATVREGNTSNVLEWPALRSP